MKINHIVSSIDSESGGPARSVTHLVEALLRLDEELNITLNTLNSKNPIISDFLTVSGKIVFYKANFLGYSKELDNYLKLASVDLFHGHGLWQAPVYQMSKIAHHKKIPYILTPRGMLEPWSLSQGKLKKKIALSTFQLKHLKNAICLHATAPMEVESIRKLGLTNPIAMIPNGIDIANFPKELPIKHEETKKILFLSRIHQKKGIENLILAWKQIENIVKEDWVIEIIGNGESNYISELKNMIKTNNLQEEIFIKKPVFGNEKINSYRDASLFVLPTFSENFGIVVAEALASYTPVITTKGAPWQDLNTHKCGWWIDIGVNPLKEALVKATTAKNETLLSMGVNGRKLIEDKYSMESVSSKMLALYKWILKKGDKPKFIY